MTAATAQMLVCPTCDGRHTMNCPTCGGAGAYEITGCPREQLDAAAVHAALRAEAQAAHGRWPRDGGWLDQTQWTLDAVEFVQRDRARAEAQLTEG